MLMIVNGVNHPFCISMPKHYYVSLSTESTHLSQPRYMKRLVSEMSPAAGINFSDGYQATAVGKALVDGGTLVSYSKKLPKHVVYDGAPRRAIEWDTFSKEKKLRVLNL